MSKRSSLRQKVRAPQVDAPSNVTMNREGATPRTAEPRNVSRPWLRISTSSNPLIPASLRDDMIRDAAYLRAQTRGFAPGSEVEDWLAAEQEVDELIVRRYAC